MNSTPNSNSSQPADANQPDGSSNPQASTQPGRCVFDPLCSAVNEGAHQARAAAKKAIPRIKAVVSGATYWLGYGVSFASVFSYSVATELAPESLKTGCRDGAAAGRKAGADLSARLQPQSEATGASPSPGDDPSSTTTQPGAA